MGTTEPALRAEGGKAVLSSPLPPESREQPGITQG